MKPTIHLSVLALLILTSCSSVPPAERPPRYGKGVQAVMLDSTPRVFNPTVEVFQRREDLGDRPRRTIAIVSHDGWPNDQAALVTALIWKAKALGADAIILHPPEKMGYEFNAFAHSGVRYMYKGDAILWSPSSPVNPHQTPATAP